MMAGRKLSRDIYSAMATLNTVGQRTGPPATSHPSSLKRQRVSADQHGGGMNRGDMLNTPGMAATTMEGTGLVNSRNGISFTTANVSTGDALFTASRHCFLPYICSSPCYDLQFILYTENQLPKVTFSME